jgi:hypothetical protein
LFWRVSTTVRGYRSTKEIIKFLESKHLDVFFKKKSGFVNAKDYLNGKGATGYGCSLFNMKAAEMLILTGPRHIGSMEINYIMAFHICRRVILINVSFDRLVGTYLISIFSLSI